MAEMTVTVVGVQPHWNPTMQVHVPSVEHVALADAEGQPAGSLIVPAHTYKVGDQLVVTVDP